MPHVDHLTPPLKTRSETVHVDSDPVGRRQRARLPADELRGLNADDSARAVGRIQHDSPRTLLPHGPGESVPSRISPSPATIEYSTEPRLTTHWQIERRFSSYAFTPTQGCHPVGQRARDCLRRDLSQVEGHIIHPDRSPIEVQATVQNHSGSGRAINGALRRKNHRPHRL